jgi:hypothetical protein
MDIDFIVTWVDGSDPEWIKLYNRYAPEDKQKNLDLRTERYRDFDTMRYWFRAVNKFAPWVHTVQFVTNGQKPDWLNLDCPKLNWVKHSDYIPEEYLPVFSSRPIELYSYKIKGLSDHFVIFCDDIFLGDTVKPDFFFKKGLPCDSAILDALAPHEFIDSNVLNDFRLINNHFDRNDVLKRNFVKWFTPVYGKTLMKTFFMLPTKGFCNLANTHMANGYTKELFKEVWALNRETLENTMAARFRSPTDVNEWLFKYWNIVRGTFYPVNPHKGKKYFSLTDHNDEIYNAICSRKYKEFVLQDSDEITDKATVEKGLKAAFESIFPEKSPFEL